MEKKYVFLILLLLTIGFASVNTVIDINGKVDMSLLESDLDVVFKEVLLNNEKSDNTIIIENGKSFIYSADDLNSINKTSTIDYVVMNKSHQYDVEVVVSCINDYEDNLSYKGTFDNNKLPLEKGILIKAGEVKSGDIITELIKENTSDTSLALKCTLNYIPVSRESIVNEEEYIVSLDSGYEEKISDIKVKYYEEYSKLPELTRNNYKFLGWYTEDDIKVDNNSLVKIKGNHTLKAKWEKICEYDPGRTWTFNYTGSEQSFMVPCDGEYKIELWGAGSGANRLRDGIGFGGYTSGIINFPQNKHIYIYVGGSGTLATTTNGTTGAGYNGGGAGGYYSSYGYTYGGGGATDVRLVKGTWNNFNSLKSRIIVSGGGAGWFYSAGGLSSYGYTLYPAATQTSGNAFGYGCFKQNGSGGGGFGSGGGYYGGNCAVNGSNGAGGSSFISGHNGCDAIAENSTSSKIIHMGQANHYSGYVFTDTVMIDGQGYNWTNVKGEYTGMPSHDGTSTITGNSGNGYAKITYLGK